jgi:DNA-binding NtrC family response regulator
VDLFYRLDVASIEMPALRDIPGAIPSLAKKFVVEYCDQEGRPEAVVTAGALDDLRQYAWPGNVRELRNAVERSLIFHRDGPLDLRPPDPGSAALPQPEVVSLELGLTLEEVERRYLDVALARHGDGHLERLAAELGIARKTLWEKRRRYGL